MSELYLVRHGQARFLTDDYDRLSELGEQQAYLLGKYWAARRIAWDKVWHGPLKRHQQTLQAVKGGYEEHSTPLPASEMMPDLKEIPAFEILAAHGPPMPTNGGDAGQDAKTLVFRSQAEILRRWIDGETFSGFESWQACRARAASTLDSICDSLDRGEKAVVFGSGGSICLMLASVLGLGDQQAWDMALSFTNTAWSELRVSASRRTLVTFNSRPHLDDDSLITLV